MHAECAGWLARWYSLSDEHRTPDQILDLLAQSYRAGYEDGRTSTRSPPPKAPS